MKIIILGMGSAALSIADILTNEYNYEIAGFVGTKEEDIKFHGKEIYRDFRFLGDRSIMKNLINQKVGGFIVAIGDRYVREEAYYQACSEGLVPINAISKNAFLENNIKIGSGVVISSGCIIQHGVTIGDNCFLASGSIFDFKSSIAENCNISAGCIIGSNTKIEKNVLIGARAIITPKILIGKNQNVESNILVNKNLPGLLRKQ